MSFDDDDHYVIMPDNIKGSKPTSIGDFIVPMIIVTILVALCMVLFIGYLNENKSKKEAISELNQLKVSIQKHVDEVDSIIDTSSRAIDAIDTSVEKIVTVTKYVKVTMDKGKNNNEKVICDMENVITDRRSST